MNATASTINHPHCTNCGRFVEVLRTGRYAGIWSCSSSSCGASDSCAHPLTHTESFPLCRLDGLETISLLICSVCDQTVDEETSFS